MTQIDPQLLADFQAFQAFQAMNAQESGVIVEADATKPKTPRKTTRKTTATKTPTKTKTTRKATKPANPATPPVNCLTLGDIWLAMGADEDFEPSAEKIDNPAYGNWLARANHLGLLTIA